MSYNDALAFCLYQVEIINDPDPDGPWTDPISGEVDYEAMEEDLGVNTGIDDDDFEEY